MQATAASPRDAAAHWVLRLGAAACFIGHGAFGILTKEAWVPYFALVGIPRDWAFNLMPVVGTVDVVAGVSILFKARPAVLVYMTVWAIWTALLRPLTGESPFETLERAGNYGVPLALLLLVRGHDTERVMRVLLLSTALLLFGHGGLAVLGKPLLASHVAYAGLSPDTLAFLGFTEMTAALVLLAQPSAPLLLAVAAWKLSTEALFPMTGAPIWEFVERGGSYSAPIALVLLMARNPFRMLTLRRTT
jgi:hypothetical protein